MASPQIEDGYTKIANELLDVLCRFRIHGSLWQVVAYVLRYSYGYNRKKVPYNLGHIAETVKQSKTNICHKLKILEKAKIIIVLTEKQDDIFRKYIKFNKNYEEWQQIKSRANIVDTGDNTIDTGDNIVDTGDNIVDTGDNDPLTPVTISVDTGDNATPISPYSGAGLRAPKKRIKERRINKQEESTSVLSARQVENGENENAGNHGKKSSAKTKKLSDMQIFFEYCQKQYLRERQDPLNINYRKDGSLIKKLLKLPGVDFKLLCQAYKHALTMEDDFINSIAPLTIGVFFKCFNKILMDMRGQRRNKASPQGSGVDVFDVLREKMQKINEE